MWNSGGWPLWKVPNASETRMNAGRGGCASGGAEREHRGGTSPLRCAFTRTKSEVRRGRCGKKRNVGGNAQIDSVWCEIWRRVKRAVCASASNSDEGVNVYMAEGCRGQCRDDCTCVCSQNIWRFLFPALASTEKTRERCANGNLF